MVCIDTSVLIATYRDPHHRATARLEQIARRGRLATCGQIWLEFIGGFRTAALRRTYSDGLSAMTYLSADRTTFERAADWCGTVRGIGAGDALIAATVLAHDASLLTLDAGFEALRPIGLRLEPF